MVAARLLLTSQGIRHDRMLFSALFYENGFFCVIGKAVRQCC